MLSIFDLLIVQQWKSGEIHRDLLGIRRIRPSFDWVLFYSLFTNVHIPNTRKSMRIISCIYKIRGKHRRIHNTVNNNPWDKQDIGQICWDIQVFNALPHLRLEPLCPVDAVFFKQDVENKYITSRDITQGALLRNKCCGKDMCENLILKT